MKKNNKILKQNKNTVAKNKIILQIILFLITIFISIFLNKSYAKVKSIDNLDYQIQILKNGSIDVEETITISPTSKISSITYQIDYAHPHQKNEKLITPKNKLNPRMYSADTVILKEIGITENNKYEKLEPNIDYTLSELTENYQNIVLNKNIYSDQFSLTTKYTLTNICKLHNDYGELNFNLLKNDWNQQINNLNIDVYLPLNTGEFNCWAHGPAKGSIKKINNNHINFNAKNFKDNKKASVRLLFDKANISKSTNETFINSKDYILKEEKSKLEYRQEKNSYTSHILIIAGCLLVYWIILLLVFEKDKKYIPYNVKEDELFDKYDPLSAGCIQGSRNVQARDIIAVILNLINKGQIKFNFEHNSQTNNDNKYTYYIKPNPQSTCKINKIENYIYEWIFNENEEINLVKRLEELPKEKTSKAKFKALNKMTKRELYKLGANKLKVPLVIRGFNIFLLILSIAIIIKHIVFNGNPILSSASHTSKFTLIIFALLLLLPLILSLTAIPLNIMLMIRHKVNKKIQQISGSKVVTTTIALIILFTIIIIVTAIFSPIKFIIADEILLCIASIIVLTDNLMLKNDTIMIEDFSKLNALKNRIEEYTLLNDKNFESITLWDKYLSYGVSFGIGEAMLKTMENLHIDDDISNLITRNSTFSNFLLSDYMDFYSGTLLKNNFEYNVNDFNNT